MLQLPQQVQVQWRATASLPYEVRARVEQELHGLWWNLNQMEALMLDAHHATALDHAFLMPRMELSLPIYDMNRRFRIMFTFVDELRIHLMERDRRLADIILH